MPNLSVLDFDSGVFALAMRNQDASHQVMFNETSKFVESILQATQADYCLGFLGGEGNFRKEVATSRPYKGNRGPKPESVVYWGPIIEQYLVDQWGFVRCHGIEADDACSIAFHTHKDTFQVTVGGVDHDLYQLPCTHYQYSKGTFTTLSEEEASHNLWMQILTGCQGDDVPGLKGWGPKKALNLLSTHTSDYSRGKTVRDTYMSTGAGLDCFQEQYTLLKLLDHEAYGFILPQPLPVPVTQLPQVEEVDIAHLFV